MSSRNEELLRLASELERSTRTGRVKWRTTDRPDSFLYVGASGGATIQRADYGRAGMPSNYTFRVLNSSGEEVDSISVSQGSSAGATLYGDVTLLSALQTLESLHKSAATIGNETKQIVDGLIGELSNSPSEDRGDPPDVGR